MQVVQRLQLSELDTNKLQKNAHKFGVEYSA